MKTVEFLLYTLKPGTGKDFHRIMTEESAPLHRSAGMDIISFGISAHDNDAYYLIRAYNSLSQLKSSQEFFTTVKNGVLAPGRPLSIGSASALNRFSRLATVQLRVYDPVNCAAMYNIAAQAAFFIACH